MKIQSPFIKFLGVGVINTCIGLSVTFLCLTLFGLPYWPSTFIGNGAGALASFFLNRRFTFRSDVRVGSGLFRFILVIFLCYLLSYKAGLALAEGALRHLEPVERYTEEWAVLFGNGLYTVTNYFGQKWFVFRKTKTNREWGENMARKFCNKPFFIGIACLIIGLWTAPYFILGEDAHMRIHDNLDSNIAWYKVLKESGQLFAPGDAPIGQIINGELKRNAFYTEFYAMIALFMVFPPVIAYGLSQLITRLLAFIGMYLLLKDFIVKDERAWFIQIGTALTFSLIPYWPSGMLSILGMPLALWAFLHIRAGKAKWFHYLILTGLPFLSSFVLGFFYFLTAMGVVWLIDAIRTRKWNVRFLLAIVYMTGIYLLMDHRLVTSMLLSHEPTNRDVFYESKNSLAATFKLILKNYIFAHNQDRSVHDKLILPFSLLCLVYVIWKKRWKEEKLFLFLHFFHLALSAWYAFWFYEGWQPLKERVGILNSFNFSRFHYFSPVVVYALFALSLKILADAVRSWPFLGGERTERLGKAAAAGLILAQFLILVPYNEQIYYRHSPSFKQFYAEKQFQEIKAYIGKPAEDYRVASIGIHPAIAQYNGFYTLDTYNNIYPLSYKLEFRKIIERELEKDKTIRDYFDHWGGRCYIFTAELGKHYMFSKRSERVIKDLDLNTEQFKKMGGEYILSAVPILNAEENGLALEKVFEDDDSWWRIYLYRVNG